MLSNKQIIIDFKKHSPKHGELFNDSNVIEIAKSLEAAGIRGISVVTEEEHFGGSLKLLESITKAVSLPVIRKDFIKTERDLKETADCGATEVLLIAAITQNIDFLYNKAIQLGLNPLFEVHTVEEMQLAKRLNAKFIGINNRDIKQLERDNGGVELTKSLIKRSPKDTFIISESGINNPIDAKKAIEYGADAVLIGTAFWQGKFDFIFRKDEDRNG